MCLQLVKYKFKLEIKFIVDTFDYVISNISVYPNTRSSPTQIQHWKTPNSGLLKSVSCTFSYHLHSKKIFSHKKIIQIALELRNHPPRSEIMRSSDSSGQTLVLFLVQAFSFYHSLGAISFH